MYKTAKGYCELQKKNVEVMIECIPADTYEGAEYAKNRLACKYNDANHTCQRNTCPIWCNFRP